jgi:N-acetylmuramoyl-L-alanine amidase
MKTIVIDAGHGGHDVGCLGSSSQEKNIALAVSLKLGALIEKHFPDIRVIYTRETDVFIELHERAAIANKARADLFICIHCNSGPSAAFGSETYVMGLHKTADNLSVAKRENASILLEKDYKTNYDGFDPNSPEANIIFSLYQNTFMNQSLHFASLLQDQFAKNSGRFNRGVKQAGFMVLFRTAMPSVLIELGFLTNKSDEKFLISEKGQDSMAGSIMDAFKMYRSDTEKRGGGNNQPVANQGTEKPSVSNTTDSAKASQDKALVNENQSVDDSLSVSESSGIAVPGRSSVFYTIQVAAIPNPKPVDETRYNKLPDPYFIPGDDGITRFYSGNYTSLDEARKTLMTMKQQGFKDAFISAFSGAKRISMAEAGELLKRK